MRHNVILAVLLVATGLVGVRHALAGQAPAAASDPDIPISHQDRVYSAEQFFEQVATIPVGKLPHGIWPSGDGTRVYVGLENEDKVIAIDTLKNEVIATSPIGQAPQALVYVPDAVPAMSGTLNAAMTRMTVVPEGLGTSNLHPLGIAGQSADLWLAPPGAKKDEKAPTAFRYPIRGWCKCWKPRSPVSRQENRICLHLRANRRALAFSNRCKAS